MVKVLRILNRFNVGGPTHNATFLTKYLEPQYKTKLIAGKKLDSEATSEYILKKNNIDYFILENMSRSLSLINDVKSFLEIRKIIREYKPNIVHTHASKSGALGRLAAILSGVPIIVHTFHGHVFHSYFGRLKTYLYLLVERFLASKSSAIIAISNLQKDELVNNFKICSSKKMYVIPLGFDLERFQLDKSENRNSFRTEFALEDDCIAIGIVGRLTAIKNQELFLRSVKEVTKNSKKPLKVFLIGDGEDKEKLQSLCEDLNMPFSERYSEKEEILVYFTSWRQDMERVYAGLDIVALSSLNEGTPVTLIEAQAANKPIVATDVGGIRDIIIENKTGLLSKSGDLKGLEKNLRKLIDDDNLRDQLGRSGYDNVIRSFSYKRLVSDVKSLYTELLKK
tara:strand:- start:4 stop:1191 length:1188 start_codon:yes stop_codon:yes gene_type:complete